MLLPQFPESRESSLSPCAPASAGQPYGYPSVPSLGVLTRLIRPANLLETQESRLDQNGSQNNSGLLEQVAYGVALWMYPGGFAGERLVRQRSVSKMDLRGKRVVMTGSAGGIGAVCAAILARYGATITLSDLDGAAVADLTGKLRQEGFNVFSHRTDVTDPAQCEELLAKAHELMGGVDVLFNSAGIMPRFTVPDMPVDLWHKVIDVSLTGTFLCSKYAIPIMRSQGGGVIINNASGAALVGNKALAAYGAAKAGIVTLTKCMAVDHGEEGIRVNCICPGAIDTEMNRSWIRESADPATALRELEASHVLGRMGQPNEVGEMVAFLVSDTCSFMTGSTVIYDGGLTVMGHRFA